MDEMLINVNVVLVSGRSICLSAQPSSSIGDLKAAAANGLGHRFLKLLSADGRSWNLSESLEAAGIQDGDSLTAIAQVPKLAATDKAFAIWCSGGGVITWGDSECGAEEVQLNNLEHLSSSFAAFAAVSFDGRMACWGKLEGDVGVA
eukprot:Skav217782  [mRNA]  locus=scaffold1782:143681:144599:- [translate_table: standard]